MDFIDKDILDSIDSRKPIVIVEPIEMKTIHSNIVSYGYRIYNDLIEDYDLSLDKDEWDIIVKNDEELVKMVIRDYYEPIAGRIIKHIRETGILINYGDPKKNVIFTADDVNRVWNDVW